MDPKHVICLKQTARLETHLVMAASVTTSISDWVTASDKVWRTWTDRNSYALNSYDQNLISLFLVLKIYKSWDQNYIPFLFNIGFLDIFGVLIGVKNSPYAETTQPSNRSRQKAGASMGLTPASLWWKDSTDSTASTLFGDVCKHDRPYHPEKNR